jgi:hypothetical protein
MCYREVITVNECCAGTVCKEPGNSNPDRGILKCCIDYDTPGYCVKNRDCCDDHATCVKPPGSATGTCCIKQGNTCTEGDGGCCNGLLCTAGKCEDCLGQDLSCPSGGLDCCAGLVCTPPAITYPYTGIKTCLPCTGKDEGCYPYPMPGSPSCCGELECVPRAGFKYMCSDCIPSPKMGCQVDEDCCDSLVCSDMGYGMTMCH